MRWHFGGNLQPVRMICEYDWKECPIAVFSYIWSEIVTDVVESITGEAQLWRILAVMILCSMLLRAVYCKMKWSNNKNDQDYVREDLIRVEFKMQDLELKINILTYKMQYGTWPLPHEIQTPSLNDVKNAKLALSNDNNSGHNFWTKDHLHGYISKYFKDSGYDKSMEKLLPIDLKGGDFLSHVENKNTLDKKLKLSCKDDNSRDCERLVKTAKECRRYMDEINESNKSLGLFDDSSDISDRNSFSTKDNSGAEIISDGFLVDPKKWHEIYKHENQGDEEDPSEMDLGIFNGGFSMSNVDNRNSTFCGRDEKRILNNSGNRSKLLPPGLSITFLSDKFESLKSRDKYSSAENTRIFQNRNNNNDRTSTNETLKKVEEKLKSFNDFKQHPVKNSRSLSDVGESFENKKNSEKVAASSKKRNSQINSNYVNIFGKLISSECDSSSGDNGLPDSMAINVNEEKLNARHSYSCNEHESMFKSMKKKNSFRDIIAKSEDTLGSNFYPLDAAKRNINEFEICFEYPSTKSNKNLIGFPMKKSAEICSESKIIQIGKNSFPESDSSVSSDANLKPLEKKDLSKERKFNSNINFQEFSITDANKNVLRNLKYILNDKNNIENNTSLKYSDEKESILHEENLLIRMRRDNEEDAVLASETSSIAELSKDSDDTDEKSTRTLLREALEFKKVLLMQIDAENNEICCDKSSRNESSEYDSDDTSKSKTENHFRSKLLDIISEEQSAGSSTERTSRTYILSKVNKETNLCEESQKDLKDDKIIIDTQLAGDSKSLITASSSEYFSVNEPNSVKNVDQSSAEKEKDESKEESTVLENKFQVISEKTPRREKTDNCYENSTISGIENAQSQINATKSDERIEFIKKLGSIDSENGISSWSSISESPSIESIAQFVNALSNIESKNVNIEIENGYSDSRKRHLKIIASEDNDGFVKAILEMMGDSEIFEFQEPEARGRRDSSEEDHRLERSNLSFKMISQKDLNLELDEEKAKRKQDEFSKLKTLDAFTKPFDMSESNSEKNYNDEDSSPLISGRTVVHICKSSTTTNLKGNPNPDEAEARDFGSNDAEVEHEDLNSDKSEIVEPRQISNSSDIGNREKIEMEAEEDCDGLKSDKNVIKVIENSKRNNLSISSITNFSTDTSESYFDVSNHDFAVSSIILTSENFNPIPNRGDEIKSDTSSSYVDASDDCSKISNNADLDSCDDKIFPSESKVVIEGTNKIVNEKNLESENESARKVQLDPKSTMSLPSPKDLNDLKSLASSNSEKIYSKSRSTSRSCIPILKSRIEYPSRENSIEGKKGARSRSPVRRSNTPRVENLESNSEIVENSDNEKKNRHSINGSRKSLNNQRSHILPTKNSDAVKNCLRADISDPKIEGPVNLSEIMKPNVLNNSGELNKECTVIYINIISDSDRSEGQTMKAKDLMKYVHAKEFICGDKKFNQNTQSLSLRNIKSDKPRERKYEFNMASPSSDSKLLKNLFDGIKNGNGNNEKASIVCRAEENEVKNFKGEKNSSEIILGAVKTSNKLLSTSTLELLNPVKIEQKEIEILAKPSVKNISTSVSDFPDSNSDKKISFHNPANEVFDTSKDFLQNE